MTDDHPTTSASKRSLWGWALYDWANSPFTTVIITFVFSTYFARSVVGDETQGQSLWGYTNAISGLAIAIGSPIFGAIADVGGRRKPWIAVFTLVCAFGSCALWFVTPERSSIPLAMIWVVLATIGFEFGIVFNNAMLPDLVDEKRLGRWSGWAWGLGYAGGLIALLIALFAFVQTDTPLFGLDNSKTEQQHIRIVGPLVGIWFLLFVWPLFAFTPDRPSTNTGAIAAVRLGLKTVRQTLAELPRYKNLARFLIARMIYADGLATVFAIGGTYAAGVFGMSFTQVIYFGLLLNVTAGVGAACFAWVDDWIGSKKTILISIVGLAASALLAVLATDVTLFWIAGAALGVFVGPAQSASRSMMARIAPREMMTEFFGLYALTGKATAFLGPIMVAVVTDATGNQRSGMVVILAFFVIGGWLLRGVREERALVTHVEPS
ncbi:MAG: MFS transporter [Myxococcota bacterium]